MKNPVVLALVAVAATMALFLTLSFPYNLGLLIMLAAVLPILRSVLRGL